MPDGLVLDVPAGHIYWTNMGDPISNDGSVAQYKVEMIQRLVDAKRLALECQTKAQAKNKEHYDTVHED